MNDAAGSATGDAPTGHAGDGIAVDREHPWLGLASFTEDTRAWFHGREEEVAELARRVQRKLLTVLFGQSGLGKTSILRAGLVPKLRPDGYCPVYVRIDYAPESPPPAEQIKQAIFRETQGAGSWTQTGVAVEGESLWEFLHHRDDVLRDADGRALVPLLIFDQFEEVFTIAQGDAFGRERAAQFLADLADLVENRPPKALEARLDEDDSAIERFDFTRADYRILIALREDYLAHLEGLKATMPSITQNRMRLARMTGVQALEAVTRPGGKLVSHEVAESIVRFVAGGAELRNAEVEPALLSLVCRELNNARIAKGRGEISADVLAGSRDTILAEFYERAIGDQPEAVRKVIEDHLLTESGYRESLAEERLQKLLAAAGATPGTMAKLVDRRLLRIEERLDVRRVELTHDVLTGVVKASRDVRLEREAREAAEAKLSAQRERERATRRALVRARQVAAGCAVLAAVAAGSAIYGYFATERAKAAEAKAEATRLAAEQARGEAEKLVLYLLDDFQLELAPVGRLDIVAELARRAIDYYGGLPPELRNAQSERNRALALVRYGTVLRTQARLAEAGKAVEEAVQVLGRMRDEGDRSEPTLTGLALGISTQARIASSLNEELKALEISARAAETIRPLATGARPSVALRRAFGEVMIMHGFLQARNRQEAAIASLEEARAAFRAIDGLALNDLASAAGYAESSSWLVQANRQFGRNEEAKRAGREALEIAAKVLEKRPGHMQALRAQALTTSPLSALLSSEMRLAEALAAVDVAQRAWREFVRLDPGNAISWGNLGVSNFIKANILESMGRLDEAAATWRSTEAIVAQAPTTLQIRNGAALHAYRLAALEAQRGNRREAEAALALGAKHNNWVSENAATGSWEALSRPIYRDIWPVAVAEALGDRRIALELGRAVSPQLDRLEPRQPTARREYAFTHVVLRVPLAQAAYALEDFARADRELARVAEFRQVLGDEDFNDVRAGVFERTLAALVKVRLGEAAQARALIEPALAFQRELAARNVDDPSQHLELAAALCVAAAAGVGDPARQLAEASALLDRLPAEMKRASYVAFWRERIDEARARRR
jgi:tetratricopeptide (TPR) repeat protein